MESVALLQHFVCFSVKNGRLDTSVAKLPKQFTASLRATSKRAKKIWEGENDKITSLGDILFRNLRPTQIKKYPFEFQSALVKKFL